MEMIFRAKSLEEAKNKAYAYFVEKSRDELEIKILEQPEKKLFGMKGEYKISASYNDSPVNSADSDVFSESETTTAVTPDFGTCNDKTAVASESETTVAVTAGKTAVATETDLITQFLTDLITELGIENFTVAKNESEENIIYDITAEKPGVIIGHRGETLEAISYLAVLALARSKSTPRSENDRIIFADCNGYRKKRTEQLEESAVRTAERVRRYGRKITLDPMSAYERRIVHNKIASMSDMKSVSTGDEPNRKVVISSASDNTGLTAARTAEKPNTLKAQPTKSDKNYGKYKENRKGHTDDTEDSDETAYRTKDFKKNFRKNQNKSQTGEYRSYKQSPGFSTSFEREYKGK